MAYLGALMLPRTSRSQLLAFVGTGTDGGIVGVACVVLTTKSFGNTVVAGSPPDWMVVGHIYVNQKTAKSLDVLINRLNIYFINKR